MQLCYAYYANEVDADAKYTGKTLRVSGQVLNVGKALFGEPYINLVGGVYGSVRCGFSKSYESELAQVRIGQGVTVEGMCKGGILVQLEDCVLVR